ncbi:hypothetical protein [Streptomyces sp. 8N616]|uniref:hypothetical protein n=1 Tax=Streptomyces sp. 8N616 TaxID=3457414 RepID=UPI003FD38C75
MARDLLDAGLGSVEMMVECKLPDVEGPADVVLAGMNPQTGDHSYVVVELKQWKQVVAAQGSAGRFKVRDMPGGLKKHPAEQVAAFCRELLNTHAVFENHEERLAGMTYLHNASENDVADLLARPRTRLSHIFTRDSRGALMAFLRSRLTTESGEQAAERFREGDVSRRGSAQRDPLSHQRWGRAFELTSDPSAAAHYVLDLLRSSHWQEQKSVLALMGDMAGHGTTLVQAMVRMLNQAGYETRQVDALGAVDAPPCDVLICEESRLRRSEDWLRPREGHAPGTSSVVADLIAAARVPVFFLQGEKGSVRDGDVRMLPVLKSTAREMGVSLRKVPLDKEFR